MSYVDRPVVIAKLWYNFPMKLKKVENSDSSKPLYPEYSEYKELKSSLLKGVAMVAAASAALAVSGCGGGETTTAGVAPVSNPVKSNPLEPATTGCNDPTWIGTKQGQASGESGNGIGITKGNSGQEIKLMGKMVMPKEIHLRGDIAMPRSPVESDTSLVSPSDSAPLADDSSNDSP